jgi:uncharacterized coiled-coil protein SlyX
MSQNSSELDLLIQNLRKVNSQIIKNSKIIYESSKEIEVYSAKTDKKTKHKIAELLQKKKLPKKVSKKLVIIKDIISNRLNPAREKLQENIKEKKELSKKIISYQLHNPQSLENIQKKIVAGLGDGTLERAEQIVQYHNQMLFLLKQISEMKEQLIKTKSSDEGIKLKYYRLVQEYDKMDKKISDELTGKNKKQYVRPLPLKKKQYVQPLPLKTQYVQPLPLIEFSKEDILLSDFCDMLTEKNVHPQEKEYILGQMALVFSKANKLNNRTQIKVSDTLAVTSRFAPNTNLRKEAIKTYRIWASN